MSATWLGTVVYRKIEAGTNLVPAHILRSLRCAACHVPHETTRLSPRVTAVAAFCAAKIFLPELKSAADDGGDIEKGETEIVTPSSERRRKQRRRGSSSSIQRGGTDTGSAIDSLFQDTPFPFNLAGGLMKVSSVAPRRWMILYLFRDHSDPDVAHCARVQCVAFFG